MGHNLKKTLFILVFFAYVLAGSAGTAQAQCGFTANNDYVCGEANSPPGASNQTSVFAPPTGNGLPSPNGSVYSANPAAALDYQKQLQQLQDIQDQMAADEERLANLDAWSSHLGGGTPAALPTCLGAVPDVQITGTTYYVSPNGSGSCTQSSPCSFKDALAKAGPGDGVLLQPGSYERTRIRLQGTAENPVTISTIPGSSERAVLNGLTSVIGQGGILSGLEFNGDSNGSTEGKPAIQTDASYLTIKDSYIHRDIQGTTNGIYHDSADCIKILGVHMDGSPGRPHDIHIYNNEIAYCGEDAIDSTGAYNLVYQSNNIHHAKTMQIKGGTENVLVEGNHIHNMGIAVGTGGMSCTNYCGSDHIPELPVSERFVAKDVLIRNNVIHDMDRTSWIIATHGWKNVEVTGNTLYDISTTEKYFRTGSAGFDFYDSMAKDWCASGGEGCSSCKKGSDCVHIKFSTKNANFHDNSCDINIEGCEAPYSGPPELPNCGTP